jgi:hypothetical protein
MRNLKPNPDDFAFPDLGGVTEPSIASTSPEAHQGSVPTQASVLATVSSSGNIAATNGASASYFPSASIGGQTYDLGHLDPFTFRFTADGLAYAVKVIFSCHCFTEGLQAHHTPQDHYTHDGETRAFCVERHGLSIMLPGLVQSLGTVYHNTKWGNFFFWKNHQLQTATTPYLVFFNMAKSTSGNADVLMNINSAHLKPNMTQFAAPVKFKTLVEAKAKGRKLKTGKPIQIKRK